MKHLLSTCFMLLFITKIDAQAKLDITRLVNLPDTVYLNEIRNVTATLKNIGSNSFSGLVYFDVMVDSANGGLPTYYRLDSAFVNLAANGGLDSIEAYYQVPIVIPAGFKVGGNGNTVVIWPRAQNNLIPNDSIVVPVYVKVNQVGIEDLGAFSQNLVVSPNPAANYITVSSNQINAIGAYKIKDIAGKELVAGAFIAQIELNSFGAGLYFIEFYDHTNRRISTKKIIKE
ncbi:MAG: T9SS type A sorting domain-containing protein [Bacteroidota bacterium]